MCNPFSLPLTDTMLNFDGYGDGYGDGHGDVTCKQTFRYYCIIYLDGCIVEHSSIKHAIAQVTRDVQREIIKAVSNNAASLPVGVNLWVIRTAPCEEIRPAQDNTQVTE